MLNASSDGVDRAPLAPISYSIMGAGKEIRTHDIRTVNSRAQSQFCLREAAILSQISQRLAERFAKAARRRHGTNFARFLCGPVYSL